MSLYQSVRDLHLYFGLLVSPFVLLFSVSVFYLNHGKLHSGEVPRETYSNLQMPQDLDRLRGRSAIEQVRLLLPQLNVAGEIGFPRYRAADRHLMFAVTRAGVEATVDIDLASRSAVVSRRSMNLWESLAYLHKMPGPHNVAIRGNWIGIRIWRWLADGTIALLLFISVSGIYLWWALKMERRVGIVLLMTGAATFVGLIYAVAR